MARYHRHPVRSNQANPRSYQANQGLLLMILGAAIGSPFLLYFGLFEYMTAPIYYYSASLMAASGATVAGISGAAILGIGALVTYGAIGLGHLYFAAKEAYFNASIKDIFQSRFLDTNPLSFRGVMTSPLSFRGVMTSIATALWSPFLLIGALTGMGIKATVDAYKKRFSTSTSSNDPEYGEGNQSSDQSSNSTSSPTNYPPLFRRSSCCSEKQHNNPNHDHKHEQTQTPKR